MPDAPTMPHELGPVLAGVVTAVRKAGDLLRQEFHRPDGPRGYGSKAEIDMQIRSLLHQQLQGLLHTSYNGARAFLLGRGFVGVGWCWLVNPHDGSSAFLQGHRGSAISVALLREGVPVLGVVYAPMSPDRGDDLIAWAEGCGPVTRNGEPILFDLGTRGLEHGSIVFVSQDASRKPTTNTTLCTPARFVAIPSLAYRLARVAVGDGVAAVSLGGRAGWDYAAGHALLRGAGGTLLDESGNEIVYSSDGESECGQRCFGGAPAAVAELNGRNWDAVHSATENTVRPSVFLEWPRVDDEARLARAVGVMLGQCIGDSLGSLVEFEGPSDIAKKYPGGVRNLADGGCWNTIAGQPTDDSELALTLARSIGDRDRYDEEYVAQCYAMWLKSEPFDIGKTTATALRV